MYINYLLIKYFCINYNVNKFHSYVDEIDLRLFNGNIQHLYIIIFKLRVD